MSRNERGAARACVGIALLAVLVAAPPAAAQRLAASYGAARFDHELLGTLTGATLQLTSPRFGFAMASLGVRRLSGARTRTGIPCTGLVFPGQCPTELVLDDATASEIAGTVDLTLFRTALRGMRIEGAAQVGLQLVRIRSESRGLTTGNHLRKENTLPGSMLGFDLTTRPWPRFPIGFRLAGATGSYAGSDEIFIDGYTPFTEGFSVMRGEIGLVWFVPDGVVRRIGLRDP